MTENEVSQEIVVVALRVHRGLGPGLFESVYKGVMASALEKRGLNVSLEQIMPVFFEGIRFEMGFRADLIVGEKVIVEIKSVADLLPVHSKQLLTYLKLSGMRLGLLINFNVALIKDGIVRIANGL
ncbi:MAG TPA: GxxExxY protein [Bryobacteraceae bacterium]